MTSDTWAVAYDIRAVSIVSFPKSTLLSHFCGGPDHSLPGPSRDAVVQMAPRIHFPFV